MCVFLLWSQILIRKMNGHDDDSEILEEIRTLENVLRQDSSSESSEDDDDDDESPGPSYINQLRITNQTDTSRSSVTHAATSNPAYIANQRLIAVYKLAEERINAKIIECQQRRKELDYQIHLISRGGKANWRIPYIKAGMPYFKDDKLFPAPPNPDMIAKKAKGELTVVYFGEPHPWTRKGRNVLDREVRKQAAAKTLSNMRRQAELNNDDDEDESLVPKNWKKLGKAGPSDYDWMKISIIDLHSKHSWTACWLMWNLHLNDDVNNAEFTLDEDDRLDEIAERLKYQDWDAIAAELNTGRNGYQCFIRYHSTKSISGTDSPWSNLENTILYNCIEHVRMGNIIPWGIVAAYMNGRSKSQVYAHWKYNLDPAIKKGRFTEEEDRILLNGIQLGMDCSEIAKQLLPNRTSVQLSGRYSLIKLKNDKYFNCWSISEDRRLLSLYEEFGRQWSIIAGILKKDRTRVRHRYDALVSHLSKGMKLVNISRKTKPGVSEEEDDQEDYTSDSTTSYNNIDAELMRYFHSIQKPPARPGRKLKYHTGLELETRTKQLLNIFKKLNVTLEVPDNLDDIGLTEKEKQVLVSIRKYMNPNSRGVSPEEIEELRKKMFESKKKSNNEDKSANEQTGQFQPSASFSFVRSRGRKRRAKQPDPSSGNFTIDLTPNNEPPLKSSCLELNMTVETPENVLKLVNDTENEMFEKLASLIVEPTSEIVGRFETKYLISACPTAGPSNPTWEHRMEANEAKSIPIQSSENVDIEPCYSTLLGYKCLLDMRNTHENYELTTEEELQDFRLTAEGKQAFLLFKNRFARLFKYPIGLSRIIGDKLPYKAYSPEIAHVFEDKINQVDAESLCTSEVVINNCREENNAKDVDPLADDSDDTSDSEDSEEDEEDLAAMAVEADLPKLAQKQINRRKKNSLVNI